MYVPGAAALSMLKRQKMHMNLNHKKHFPISNELFYNDGQCSIKQKLFIN